MARYPERFIAQVAQAIDIVDVIGQYVALKKRGKEFVGLCPFHDDHHPSLYVSPTKQIFKCFACGAGGNAFQFLMKFQKITFPEAVRQLAQQAGVPIPDDFDSKQTQAGISRETLLKLLAFAARFFRDNLFSPAGASALEYARSRKLTEQSIRRFGLGWAADSWGALRSAAKEAGFTDRQLIEAGLVVRQEDGSIYDRFRNRLIFPIFDPTGKVIAFGGRALSDDQGAKYLNSPETILFDKSANLYALNWSRPAISSSEQAVVVEGYLDALMALQEGIDNVVATLGTSLTDRHVRLLSRYAREVVLVFDADSAGKSAAERALELFLPQRLHVRVATIPQDIQGVKDPCDYILAAGAAAFKNLLTQAPDAMQYAWLQHAQQYKQAKSIAEKRQIVEKFLHLVVSSASFGQLDALREGLIIGQISEMTGLSPADVASQMKRISSRTGRYAASSSTLAAEHIEQAGISPEREILEILLNAPELFSLIEGKINPEMFADPELQPVAKQVWNLARQDRLDISTLLLAAESEQWGQIVTDLQLSGEKRYDNITDARNRYIQMKKAIVDAAELLQLRQQKQQLENLKSQGWSEELLRKISQRNKIDLRRFPKIR